VALPEVDVHERLRQGCLTNIPRMPPIFSYKVTEEFGTKTKHFDT